MHFALWIASCNLIARYLHCSWLNFGKGEPRAEHNLFTCSIHLVVSFRYSSGDFVGKDTQSTSMAFPFNNLNQGFFQIRVSMVLKCARIAPKIQRLLAPKKWPFTETKRQYSSVLSDKAFTQRPCIASSSAPKPISHVQIGHSYSTPGQPKEQAGQIVGKQTQNSCFVRRSVAENRQIGRFQNHGSRSLASWRKSQREWETMKGRSSIQPHKKSMPTLVCHKGSWPENTSRISCA